MLIDLRLSQLIGSTLALEYMRAEYVAPLGSSSLIFNFLFARYVHIFYGSRNDPISVSWLEHRSLEMTSTYVLEAAPKKDN
jgi:hypothetical protein